MMTNENDSEEKHESHEEPGSLLEADETSANSGGRAPSRAKSRGSISDQRKVTFS